MLVILRIATSRLSISKLLILYFVISYYWGVVVLYGVPSPPKIKVDHNIQLDSLTINLANINIIFHSSTLYFVSQSLKLWTSTFKVTVQRSTLSINIPVNMSTMILTHGLSAKDEVWISKWNVELPKAHQSRQNSTWESTRFWLLTFNEMFNIWISIQVYVELMN